MAKNGTLGSGQPFLVVLCGVQKAPAFSQETDGVTKGPLESPPPHTVTLCGVGRGVQLWFLWARVS